MQAILDQLQIANIVVESLNDSTRIDGDSQQDYGGFVTSITGLKDAQTNCNPIEIDTMYLKLGGKRINEIRGIDFLLGSRGCCGRGYGCGCCCCP